MHGLTAAEYQTVRAILSLSSASEKERIAFSGVPSSTYTAARRRVYSEGWLTDLMVPDPGAFGAVSIDLELCRPSIADRAGRIAAWAKDPECVLLWQGIHSLFGIFFRTGRAVLEVAVVNPPPTSGGFRLQVRRGAGSVPVYFDYSGLWSRFGGRAPPTEYPAGLDLETAPASDRTLEVGRAFLASNGDPTPGPLRWAALERISRRHAGAVEQHVVRPRTILHPAIVPSYEGRRLGEVIFVQGRLRPGHTSSALLEGLTGECGVCPFLLAEADGNLLLAGVGQTWSERPGRNPAPSSRRPVTPILAEHLDPADLHLEPTEGMSAPLHHRYFLR